MGIVIALLIILGLVVVIGSVVLVTYIRKSSESSARDRAYKKAVAAIEIRKARALNSGDSFDLYAAEQDYVELRERYIAGKVID